MKKIIFPIICFFAFALMLYNISERSNGIIKEEKGDFRESYSSAENIALAREIGERTDAEEVAVIGDGKKVVAGISLPKGAKNKSTVKTFAEEIIREVYPKAQIRVEVETAKTAEILDYIEKVESGESAKNLKEDEAKLFNP